MANPWDFQYVISGWMMVALVVVPFCFGLLYGMRIAFRRYVMKMLKYMPKEKLMEILKGDEKHKDGRFDPSAP